MSATLAGFAVENVPCVSKKYPLHDVHGTAAGPPLACPLARNSDPSFPVNPTGLEPSAGVVDLTGVPVRRFHGIGRTAECLGDASVSFHRAQCGFWVGPQRFGRV